MVAGSILPFSIHKNKIYFLFGKENSMEDSAKGFSDFGGGVEKNESPYKTALREGAEELTGFLGDGNNVEKLIKKGGGFYEIVHNDYHVHAFFMEYDENLPIYYNNNHSFLWERMDKKLLNKTMLFEKIRIEWFSEKELKTRRPEFRGFYREIVDKIREHIPELKHFANRKRKRTIRKRKNKNSTRKMKGG